MFKEPKANHPPSPMLTPIEGRFVATLRNVAIYLPSSTDIDDGVVQGRPLFTMPLTPGSVFTLLLAIQSMAH